jgi:hypothetical protein
MCPKVWDFTNCSWLFGFAPAAALTVCISLTPVANAQLPNPGTTAALAPATAPAPVPAPVPAALPAAHFKKAMVIFFENVGYKETMKQPYFNEFSHMGVNLTSMFAETHPSQGNYIALMAGSTYDVNYDFNVDLDVTHLGDLLEAHGLSWRGYMENYPGNCFTGGQRGRYVRKHNPFMSFTNITGNAKRCANVVNSTQLQADLKANQLPAFSFYTPNLDNDGHDTGAAYASKWFKKFMTNMQSYPAAMKDLLIVATFDEDEGTARNRIYTVLFGDMINAGTESAQTLNHVSILRTIEDEWNLGNLGQEDATASTITNVWK